MTRDEWGDINTFAHFTASKSFRKDVKSNKREHTEALLILCFFHWMIDRDRFFQSFTTHFQEASISEIFCNLLERLFNCLSFALPDI